MILIYFKLVKNVTISHNMKQFSMKGYGVHNSFRKNVIIWTKKKRFRKLIQNLHYKSSNIGPSFFLSR